MKSCYGSKEAVVQFVADLLQSSDKGSVLTTIISLGKYGVYSAHTVIDGSLADIEYHMGQVYLSPPTNI